MNKTVRTPFQFRLNHETGVPVYRQLIDQVQAGLASGTLRRGDQLPTVRQVAVDLEINPNTVMRAYRELEIRGVLDSQQGTGTFVSEREIEQDEAGRARKLEELVSDCVTRCGEGGFNLEELIAGLQGRLNAVPGRTGTSPSGSSKQTSQEKRKS